MQHYTEAEVEGMTGEEFGRIFEGWQARNDVSLTTAMRVFGVTRRALLLWKRGQKPGMASVLLLAMAHLEDHPELLDAVRPCRWPQKMAA